MSADLRLEGGVLGIGRGGLHALRRALERDIGEQAAGALQEAGFAAGDQVYQAFRRWLREYARVDDPALLDAARLNEVLTAFFSALGWGSVALDRLGTSGLTIDSPDWAEADPEAGADVPSCFVSTGLLAAFLGYVADRDMAVMELECRSRGDGHCRFLAGAPATLQRVYEGMNAGRDYREVLEA
jgi:predicted hydrocarbon binding protein